MRRPYCTIALAFIAAIIGCKSVTPKHKIVTFEPPTALVKCIGLGKDYADLIERCKLQTWAEVPLKLEKNKRIAIHIERHQLHAIPCEPNKPWIGEVEEGLIVKCRQNTIRLYWRAVFKPFKHEESNSPRSSFMELYIPVFRRSATVYNGEKEEEYEIYGTLNRFSTFRLIGSEGPKSADDLIENALEDID